MQTPLEIVAQVLTLAATETPPGREPAHTAIAKRLDIHRGVVQNILGEAEQIQRERTEHNNVVNLRTR
jgi:hypothetical protein